MSSIQAQSSAQSIDSVARSGQSRSAPQGLPILKNLFEERSMLVEDVWGLTIMPGSGINGKTLPPLLDTLLPLGLREIHLSGGKWGMGHMTFRRHDMGMSIDRDSEWGVWRTQEEQVRKIRELCDSMWIEYVATVSK